MKIWNVMKKDETKTRRETMKKKYYKRNCENEGERKKQKT